nr:hypothetical protein [candidate division Zixibacteria bacterium]
MPLSKRTIASIYISISMIVLLTLIGFYLRGADMKEIAELDYRIHSQPLAGASNFNPETIISEIRNRYDKNSMYVIVEYRLGKDIPIWEITGQSAKFWLFSRIIYKITAVESVSSASDRPASRRMTIFITSISSRSTVFFQLVFFCFMAIVILSLKKEDFPHIYSLKTTPLPIYKPSHRFLLILLIILIMIIALIFITSYNFGEIDSSQYRSG